MRRFNRILATVFILVSTLSGCARMSGQGDGEGIHGGDLVKALGSTRGELTVILTELAQGRRRDLIGKILENCSKAELSAVCESLILSDRQRGIVSDLITNNIGRLLLLAAQNERMVWTPVFETRTVKNPDGSDREVAAWVNTVNETTCNVNFAPVFLKFTAPARLALAAHELGHCLMPSGKVIEDTDTVAEFPSPYGGGRLLLDVFGAAISVLQFGGALPPVVGPKLYPILGNWTKGTISSQTFLIENLLGNLKLTNEVGAVSPAIRIENRIQALAWGDLIGSILLEGHLILWENSTWLSRGLSAHCDSSGACGAVNLPAVIRTGLCKDAGRDCRIEPLGGNSYRIYGVDGLDGRPQRTETATLSGYRLEVPGKPQDSATVFTDAGGAVHLLWDPGHWW